MCTLSTPRGEPNNRTRFDIANTAGHEFLVTVQLAGLSGYKCSSLSDLYFAGQFVKPQTSVLFVSGHVSACCTNSSMSRTMNNCNKEF